MFVILFCKKKQILVKLKKLSAVDREGDAIIISYFFILSKIKKKNQSKIARTLSNSFKIFTSTTSFNSLPFFFCCLLDIL